DQGPGFDVTPAMQGGDKGYSSLQDMQTHIESVGGRLTIHSIPGAGTVVAGWVPGLRSSEGG
ncbi:MAG: sensor histidine kinase, partial [Chloroflexi bacterium]|nr:sensor histidine kinase [Chloroflexota bacterium]